MIEINRFRFLLECKDTTGQFYLGCEVWARSVDEGRTIVERRAREKEWEILTYEETEGLGPVSGATSACVKAETGRTYFDP